MDDVSLAPDKRQAFLLYFAHEQLGARSKLGGKVGKGGKSWEETRSTVKPGIVSGGLQVPRTTCDWEQPRFSSKFTLNFLLLLPVIAHVPKPYDCCS